MYCSFNSAFTVIRAHELICIIWIGSDQQQHSRYVYVCLHCDRSLQWIMLVEWIPCWIRIYIFCVNSHKNNMTAVCPKITKREVFYFFAVRINLTPVCGYFYFRVTFLFLYYYVFVYSPLSLHFKQKHHSECCIRPQHQYCSKKVMRPFIY